MSLARLTGVPLSDLLTWGPRDLATIADMIEEEAAARRRASR